MDRNRDDAPGAADAAGSPRTQVTLRRAAVLALAGAAFAVGAVASLELLSLALPGPRATFRTWGPMATALAAVLLLVLGVPGAIIAETVGRSGGGRPTAMAVYLSVALLAGLGLWLGWRAFVVPDASPLDLGREFLLLGGGALAVWGGARIAERSSPTPLFLFAAAAVAAVIVASAVMLV